MANLATVDLDESRARGVDLDASVDGLLGALDRSNTRGTFFVPRSFAQGRPPLTRRISDAGHEVACLTTREPARTRPYSADFTDELDATRDTIEQATGRRVYGHRNASFAVDYESEWVYDVLVDRGLEYDSSRVPLGQPDPRFQPMPRSVHAVRRWSGTLLEVPVSTAEMFAMRVRLGTTGSIRGLPLPLWAAIVEHRRAIGEPLVVHLRLSDLRWGSNFFARRSPTDRRTLERFGQIVGRFPFTSVANALPQLLRAAPILES